MTAPWNADVDHCTDCRPWPDTDDLRNASIQQALAPYATRLDALRTEVATTRRGRLALRLTDTWARRRTR